MSPVAVLGAVLRRPAPAAAGLAAVVLLGASIAHGSGLGAAGARAGAVLVLLAAGVALVGRRQGSRSSARSLSVDARQALGRDCGVAVVVSHGRRFLMGYGSAGARVLAELPREEAS